MKEKYVITEKQTLSSKRKGVVYYGTLRGAKLFASKNQMFQGTILTIESENRNLTSFKLPGQPWN